jgi:hypothetical protein
MYVDSMYITIQQRFIHATVSAYDNGHVLWFT